MIVINPNKAINIAKDMIRVWRNEEFIKNDVLIQNALVDGDTTALEVAKTRRDWLRNLPAECEGKTVEELKELLTELCVE